MKTIQILGTGCPKCKQTSLMVEKSLKQLELTTAIEKVEDVQEIMKYNVFSTPAVAIDGEVLIQGRVPSQNELIKLFTNQKG